MQDGHVRCRGHKWCTTAVSMHRQQGTSVGSLQLQEVGVVVLIKFALTLRRSFSSASGDRY